MSWPGFGLQFGFEKLKPILHLFLQHVAWHVVFSLAHVIILESLERRWAHLRSALRIGWRNMLV